MSRFAFFGAFLLAASPAAAQEPHLVPEPLLFELLAPEAAACAEAGGELEADPLAASAHTDFNGDGLTDLVFGRDALSCSEFSAHFSSSSGGPIVILVSTGDPARRWERHSFHAHGHQILVASNGLFSRPLLILTRHGAECGLSGLAFCAGAYFWAEGASGEARFFSVSDGRAD